MKSLVILLLNTEHLTTQQENLYTTGHLFRESLTHPLIRSNVHLTQQVLYIITFDPLRCILCRRDLTIQECHSYHVGQTMISLLFRLHILFVALLTTTDNMVGYIKNLNLNPLDLLRSQLVRLTASRFSRDQSISKCPAMASINPLLPSNTSSGPVIPRIARKAAWVAPKTVLG